MGGFKFDSFINGLALLSFRKSKYLLDAQRLKLDDGALKGDGDDGDNIKNRCNSENEKNVGNRAQGIPVALMGSAIGASLALSADDGEEVAPAEKRQAQADVDGRVLPGWIDGGVVNSLFLLRRKGVNHPRRKPLEQPVGM